MKTLFISVICLSIACISCKKEDAATKCYASFTLSEKLVETGQPIALTNNSIDAGEYLWDFGTGDISTLETPEYAYAQSGKYPISLTLNACDLPAIFQDTIHVVPERSQFTGTYECQTRLNGWWMEMVYDTVVQDSSFIPVFHEDTLLVSHLILNVEEDPEHKDVILVNGSPKPWMGFSCICYGTHFTNNWDYSESNILSFFGQDSLRIMQGIFFEYPNTQNFTLTTSGKKLE